METAIEEVAFTYGLKKVVVEILANKTKVVTVCAETIGNCSIRCGVFVELSKRYIRQCHHSLQRLVIDAQTDEMCLEDVAGRAWRVVVFCRQFITALKESHRRISLCGMHSRVFVKGGETRERKEIDEIVIILRRKKFIILSYRQAWYSDVGTFSVELIWFCIASLEHDILEVIGEIVRPLILQSVDDTFAVQWVSPGKAVSVVVKTIIQLPRLQLAALEVGVAFMDGGKRCLEKQVWLRGHDEDIEWVIGTLGVRLRRSGHIVCDAIPLSRQQTFFVTQLHKTFVSNRQHLLEVDKALHGSELRTMRFLVAVVSGECFSVSFLVLVVLADAFVHLHFVNAFVQLDIHCQVKGVATLLHTVGEHGFREVGISQERFVEGAPLAVAEGAFDEKPVDVRHDDLRRDVDKELVDIKLEVQVLTVAHTGKDGHLYVLCKVCRE